MRRALILVSMAMGFALLTAAAGQAAGAPLVATSNATNITNTAATLNATVNPNKQATTYNFQYGTTSSYGTSTASQTTGSGNANQSVSADITGLTPNTVYHFRVVAANPSGTTQGADQTFTTAPSPGTTATPAEAVTLTARPSPITFGATTVLSGNLTGSKQANVKVTLQSHPNTSGSFQDVATVTTNATGGYAFAAQKPLVNTRYQVVTLGTPGGPATSPTVLVNVRIRATLRVSDLTPAKGQSVRFSGTTAPSENGRILAVQRRTSTGGWVTVARTTLRRLDAGHSYYSRRLRIYRSGTYRTRVAGDASHIAGTSPLRRLRVH
jgi:hypothetical protein